MFGFFNKRYIDNAAKLLEYADNCMMFTPDASDQKERKLGAILQIDSVGVHFNLPPLLDIYKSCEGAEPLVHNKNFEEQAYLSVKNLETLSLNDNKYFLNCVLGAFFALLTTPVGTKDRKKVWQDLVHFLELDDDSMQEQIKPLSKAIRNIE